MSQTCTEAHGGKRWGKVDSEFSRLTQRRLFKY